MRVCTRCNTPKDASEFYKAKRSPGGLAAECKACKRTRHVSKMQEDPGYRARHLASKRRWGEKWREANKDRTRGRALRRLYNLTPEQHKAMYLVQNGCCAVCGEPVEYDRMDTDHDHNSGKVRGLLCRRCNTRISIFDDYELLERAIKYLEDSNDGD